MRDADDRRNASIITHSSMRCRSTSAHVGCTTNTSVPRMFSSIWNETSVSGNRCSRACPTGTPRNSAISSVSARMGAAGEDFELSASHVALSLQSVNTGGQPINVVGAGGFEPPNTGSKVPRLTAWPRPINESQSRSAGPEAMVPCPETCPDSAAVSGNRNRRPPDRDSGRRQWTRDLD